MNSIIRLKVGYASFFGSFNIAVVVVVVVVVVAETFGIKFFCEL